MAKLKHGRHASQFKALRKSRKKETINKTLEDKIYFLARKIKDSLKKKNLDAAKKTLNEFNSHCDKAVKIGLFHKNTAARKKSKLSILVHKSAKG